MPFSTLDFRHIYSLSYFDRYLLSTYVELLPFGRSLKCSSTLFKSPYSSTHHFHPLLFDSPYSNKQYKRADKLEYSIISILFFNWSRTLSIIYLTFFLNSSLLPSLISPWTLHFWWCWNFILD